MPTRIEKWKNGTYAVERDSKGHFIKGAKRHKFKTVPQGSYGAKIEKEKLFYRCSWNIKGIPVHSTPQNPIYYGFTIYGFSKNVDELYNNKSYLKSLLIFEMKKYLLSNNYVSDLATEINFEHPQMMQIDNFLNGKWKLLVEKNGRVINERNGVLR